MSIPHHLSGKFGKPRGWRRRVTLLVLLLGLSLLSAYVWLTRPQRLAGMTADLLTTLTASSVQVDSARVSLDGTIHLGRVTFRVPGLAGDAGQLFEAHEVEMKHDIVSLFRGQFVPRSLTFINPTLYLTEIPDEGKFNYDYLRQDAARDRGRDIPRVLPELFIRGGRMRFGERYGQTYEALGSLQLSGNLTQDTDNVRSYSYVLRQEQAGGKLGPVLSGRLNLENLVVQGRVERFSFEGPQRNILPRQLRTWWDSYAPVGDFPIVTFGYDPEKAEQFHAEFSVRDVELTLPFLDDKPRIRCKSGTFDIRNDNLRVVDLTGEFEQFTYVINGRINGFNDPKAMTTQSLSARLSGVVPSEPRYLPWFPEKVQSAFRRFTPTGKIEATVLLQQENPGETPTYSGYISISDARVLDARFPYALEDVKGQFTFDDKGLKITSLRGHGPTGAEAIVTGSIAPLGPDAAVHLDINASKVPIDEVLVAAMHPKIRKVFDYLLNEEAYSAMTADEAGIIQSSLQHARRRDQLEKARTEHRRLSKAELRDVEALERTEKQIDLLNAQLTRPVFDLGGKAKVNMTVTRPAGPNRTFEANAEVELAGVTSLMKFWKYPMRITSGKLRIDKTKVEIVDVKVEGLTGAKGVVNGGYFRDETDIRKRLSPKIHFAAVEMPIDPLLLTALPDEPAHWIDRLLAKGSLDVSGDIFRGDHGHHDFVIRTHVDGGSVQPWGGDYVVNNVNAVITATRYNMQIEKAVGTHGDSAFSLTGDAQWSRDDEGAREARCDLKIHGDNLDLSNPVLDLVDPRVAGLTRVRRLFEQYQPTGIFDGDLHYQARSNAKDTFQLDLRPTRLELLVRDQRISLTDMNGALVIDSDRLQIRDITAAYGDGRLEATGHVTLDEHPAFDIQFDAHNRTLDAMTRAVMPKAVVETINHLKLDGAYEINDAHLVITPLKDGKLGDTHMTFDCTAQLENATAVIGVPISEMAGQMQFNADIPTSDARPRIEMKFKSPHLRVSDRLLSDVSFRAHTDQDTHSRLIIEKFVGDCYNGSVIGSGDVGLDGDRDYRLNVTVQNAALDPFINPRKHDPLLAEIDPAIETNDDATLSAELAMVGLANDDLTRHGRGRFEIRNARFYRVPIILSMLHLLNLSMPNTSSFDQVQSRFNVDGNTVLFESIEFEAPTLIVYGQGKMAYDTEKLDMDLSIRNPEGLDLGPVSQLLKVFKDELIRIHIGGTLEEPKASLRSFPIIKRGWKNIFGAMRTGVSATTALTRNDE